MNIEIQEKFSSYPADIAQALHQIRELILKVAEQEGVEELAETLKWHEPSYSSNIGSPIRFDYKSNQPGQFFIYFNCKTRLIETFKEVYPAMFRYVGNRAIVFDVDQHLPVKELSHCFALALRYKKLKHLDLLGL